MEPKPKFSRPTLPEALDAWNQVLSERNLPTELVWLFEENLCFEKSAAAQGGLQIGFQTKFTPPSDGALDIAFDHFCETGSRIVLYRIGNCREKSVCVLLCDPWFDGKTDAESDSFLPRNEWKISFRPGLDDEIEEVTDLSRWLKRLKRQRAFHDLNFCMSLATIDEIKIYGRTLASYERFAETMMSRLRRLLGQPA